MTTGNVSQKNQVFWDELCGSGQAEKLGIERYDSDSLTIFDNWFFEYYSYLDNQIPFNNLKGKDILEIGLGFGSVSQRIVEAGANYSGLDIAKGPVEIVNERIKNIKRIGKATQGDILFPHFAGESFDFIISIGCFHHTGDMGKAINNCFKLLRSTGKLIFMVYNALSYRRFRLAFFSTISYLTREVLGYRGVVGSRSSNVIGAYDRNSQGESAPYTDWISIRSLKSMCDKFSKFSTSLENIDTGFPFSLSNREHLLQTKWPKLFGLDIYVTVEK